ncbi:MAG: hypothetical protein PVJ12_03895 [Gammaproteobacteria bacterium]
MTVGGGRIRFITCDDSAQRRELVGCAQARESSTNTIKVSGARVFGDKNQSRCF